MTERIQQSKVILFEPKNSKLLVTNRFNESFVSGSVNPNCTLDQGDIVTTISDGKKILGINSPTCMNCPFNYDLCRSHQPESEILPLAENV